MLSAGRVAQQATLIIEHRSPIGIAISSLQGSDRNKQYIPYNISTEIPTSKSI